MTSRPKTAAVSVGAHDLPGYRTFEFTWRGERTPPFRAAAHTFGFRPVRHSRPVYAHFAVIRFDAFLAAQMTTRPAVYAWTRDRPEARRRYIFLLITQGSVSMTTNGVTSAAVQGGTLAAPPSTGELRFEAHTESTFVVFTVDANEVRPLAIPGSGSTTVELARPVFRVMHDYLAEAAKSPPATDARDAETLRSMTRNIAVGLMRAAAPSAKQDGILERASAILEANAASLTFSADDVARELGVARRTLDRAYAREGLSVSDELRAQRARLARQLLTRHPDLHLDTVAQESGFASQQVMRRALERYYQSTPAELRQQKTLGADASGA